MSQTSSSRSPSRGAAHPSTTAANARFDRETQEQHALSGGDDYELLFTVSPERILDVEAVLTRGVRCTPIGRMVEAKGVECFRNGRAVDIQRRGYDHFS